MINIRGKSAWSFYTSAGGSASIGPLLASGGMFVLEDPEHNLRRFDYAGFGAGTGQPIPKLLRMPKLALPKITLKGQEFGIAGATKDFPTNGVVYITEACHGADLTPEQLEGGAIYFDLGAGWLRGYSGTLMVAGINPELLQMGIMIQRLIELAISCAPAVILMSGQNEGLQESVSADFMFGQITYKGGVYSDTE